MACQLLHQCDDTVALFEPMDVAALPRDRSAAVREVLHFFDACREQLLLDGSAPSKHVDGAVPDNPFANVASIDGNRQMLAAHGRVRIEPPPTAGFTLVIKHNAAFAALLPELSAACRMLAIVRHPLSVLASWNSVDLPVRAGRIPAGEHFDSGLAALLDEETDPLQRQLLVLEWFFSRFDRLLPSGEVLRYEDMIASQGDRLRALAGVHGPNSNHLTERNANALYPGSLIPQLVAALLNRPGSWQRWYSQDTIKPLAERMLATSSKP
ncbi:MAG: hypothetical protein M3R16_09825 [Pseudomonadota bacterium]|nr:hypothetical protein [Pseudomonadota bacterium]